MKKYIIIADLISAALLMLFLYTGVLKIMDHTTFELVLSGSPLLQSSSSFIAWALPAMELIICILLFISFTRITGLYISLLLLITFTLYLGYMLWFTPDRPCNCGGVLSTLSWTRHILFNLVFIFLSVTGLVLYKKHKEAMKSCPP